MVYKWGRKWQEGNVQRIYFACFVPRTSRWKMGGYKTTYDLESIAKYFPLYKWFSRIVFGLLMGQRKVRINMAENVSKHFITQFHFKSAGH